jgi:hypothetical protein
MLSAECVMSGLVNTGGKCSSPSVFLAMIFQSAPESWLDNANEFLVSTHNHNLCIVPVPAWFKFGNGIPLLSQKLGSEAWEHQQGLNKLKSCQPLFALAGNHGKPTQLSLLTAPLSISCWTTWVDYSDNEMPRHQDVNLGHDQIIDTNHYIKL